MRATSIKCQRFQLHWSPDKSGIRYSFTDDGHDDYVFVRAIKFARVPLHAFGDEAELSIETDGRFVGGVAAFI
ncbi:MAG TPA: hypothetical protein VFT21_01375 [Gemmatimonadaceae bacterium]|nr:hypothetical protein [Gemmatimonadaceae bacterium]